ncbi:filamentous hemagglutinin N-terminal domain-containing protein [Candidatus Neptunochlamydia vexilliferae]|nr:filamentous hemagglutinin N-terminal domain-containing protein [Candidatus Neptunochlamydia vexilliferae]
MRWKSLLLLPLTLFAQPKGLDVQSGQLSFKDGTITQSSAKAIAHWDDFSISKGQTLRFVQPSKDAAILNRVVGKNISRILGSLKANGNVILINPNGVYISGDIQTAGFIASTADVSNENFLSGKELVFGETSGEINNAGHISCPGGDVFLIAKKIDNSGEIEGHQVIIRPHSNPKVLIRADDTDISSPYKKAISHAGTIRAFATNEEDGKIYLVAVEGATEVDGTLIGDEVHVLGQEVTLKENTYIDASGPSGGTVLIGGDYQGANPEILNAKNVYVAPGAEVKADSTGSGDGGKVIYWSDGVTTVGGETNVRGGPEGGDGGFVEVSGLKTFYYRGRSDRSAPHGKSGMILFDPETDIVISGGLTTGLINAPNYIPDGAGPYNLSTNDLTTELDSGDVTINTFGAGATTVGSGDLTFNAGVSWSRNRLTCTVGNDAVFAAGIAVTNSGPGDFTVNATNGITVNSGATVSNTGTGSIVFRGSASSSTAITIDGGTVSTVSGAIDFNNVGTIDNQLRVANGGILSTSSGAITLKGRYATPFRHSSGISISGQNTKVLAGAGGSITIDVPQLNGRSNIGVLIENSAEILATGDAPITITGRSRGGRSQTDCPGIRIYDSKLETEIGDISLISIAQSINTLGGSVQAGTQIRGSDLISKGGDVFIDSHVTGVNYGEATGLYTAESTIATVGEGEISIFGDGGNTNNTRSISASISVDLFLTTISSENGEIHIEGQRVTHGGGTRIRGGSITTTGTGNIQIEGFTTPGVVRGAFAEAQYGVRIIGGATISATGATGGITLRGEGSYLPGISIEPGLVSTVGGRIYFEGTGTDLPSFTISSAGPRIELLDSSSVSSKNGGV